MTPRHFLAWRFAPGLAAFLALAVGSCEPSPNGVVDPFEVPPLLTSFSLAATSVNTDTINVGPVRSPDDLLTIQLTASARVLPGSGSDMPASVAYSVATPDGHEGSTGSLLDNGSGPDAAAGDSVYSGTVMFQLVRSTVGRFLAQATAYGDAGVHSNTLVRPVDIVRANTPPVVLEVIADTLLSLSSATPFTTLQARVTDADGLPDIRTVFFNAIRPSGPSSGNPFTMYDDGNTSGPSGDQVAGDGIYSLVVTFQGAQTGTYRFDFRAIDRSLDSSNVMVHYITVTP